MGDNEPVDDISSCLEESLKRVFVVIPMFNEEESIGCVLTDLPAVRRVFVVDNGSTDNGPAIAREAKATVVTETRRGYGQACLAGIAAIDECFAVGSTEDAEAAIVVFLDGDYSDHPDELPLLIEPIVRDKADFVVGSRTLGERESGAMHFQAIFGNRLACWLMRLFWRANFSDLGPFRAIRYRSLKQLDMQDTNYGWTIEMQIKAVRQQLCCSEIPVSYRRRIGVSKISGTISGTFKAGYKILLTVWRQRFS